MGKNWRGGRGGGRSNNKSENTFTSCRGHGVILATCDSAREREANKEIVNLIDMVLEEWKTSGKIKERGVEQAEVDTNIDKGETSLGDLLAAEVAELRDQAKKGVSQNARIINTNVKGMALIKITRSDCCPIEIIKHIFEMVKLEKKAYSRHVVRMIPLKFCFFPDEWNLVDYAREALIDKFPGMQLPVKFYSMTKEQNEKIKLAKQQEKERRKAERVQRRKEELENQAEDSTTDKVNDESENGHTEAGQKRSLEDPFETKHEIAESTQEATDTVKKLKSEQSSSTSFEEKQEIGMMGQSVLEGHSKNVMETSSSSTAKAYPPLRYSIRFKGRNHDTLTRDLAMKYITKNYPVSPMATLTWSDPDVSDTLFPTFLVITFL